MSAVQLHSSWLDQLGAEFEAPYMRKLREFLAAQKQARKVIYPKGAEMFAALNSTPFDAVRVVIIGQDPYHGAWSGAWAVLLCARRHRAAAVIDQYLSGDQ